MVSADGRGANDYSHENYCFPLSLVVSFDRDALSATNRLVRDAFEEFAAVLFSIRQQHVSCFLLAEMIYQLIYRSVATQDFWPDDLFALVEKCREKNAPRDITGMLLFHEGKFLQLLEGPEWAVKECMAIVCSDPRHRDIETLLTQSTIERDFPEWTMGFERLDEAWNMPRDWATVLETDFTSASMSDNPSAVQELLLSFRHSMA